MSQQIRQTIQPAKKAEGEGYEPESQTGQDYYCPTCWEKRQAKEVMADLVSVRPDGSEQFEGYCCDYCVEFLGHETEWYTPDNLVGFEVGGNMGYPDE